MAFAIELFSDTPSHWEDGKCAYDGRIVLGDFEEPISADGTYWSAHDYRDHWRRAVADIVGGASKAALITGMADPERSSLLWWWPLYPEGEIVHVRHGLLLFDQLEQPFDPANPARSVRERTVRNEDGFRLSEWNISMDDLRTFLNG